jgi:hypothetical protein
MAKMMMMKSAMKAMKAMKMKKTMKKTMKKMAMKKAMKKSVIAKGYKTRAGAARAVFSGRKMKTVGGLTKDKLTKSKTGKIVSKKQQAQGKKVYSKYLAKWTKAVQAARKALGTKGFQAVGGKSTKGQALLKKARSIYKK